MDDIEYKGYIIKIEQDMFADDPRHADYGNLGTIVYKHKNYKLGDREIPEYYTDDEGNEQYINTTKDIEAWLQHEYNSAIMLMIPIYMYEHGGIVLSTKSFNDNFDSGQVGYIFITADTLEKENLSIDKARQILEDEVKTLSQYVEGEVYTSYVYEKKTCDKCGHTEEEQIDGQGNVYGYDEALSLAKNCIDNLTPNETTSPIVA